MLEVVKLCVDMFEEVEVLFVVGLELMVSDFLMGSVVIVLVGGYKLVFDKVGLDGLE